MLIRPVTKPAIVIDPNETWREFFSSMANFSDPKVVPLSTLPKDYDPTKRRFHSLKTMVNWRNQNLVENYRSLPDRSCVSIDYERKELNSSSQQNQP